MKVKYDPDFLKRLKKLNVRVRNRFKKIIVLFAKDPNNSELNNHPLKRDWEGYRSINITADYRAVYKEVKIAEKIFANFVMLGTHDELYSKN